MSDGAPGPGWWLASDGKWYPPKEADEPPAPGWWLASDGKWYPPSDSDRPGPGWWLASDGKWYAPEARTGRSTPAPAASAPPAPSPPSPPQAATPGPTDDPAPAERGRGRSARGGRSLWRGRGKDNVDAEPQPARDELPAKAQPTPEDRPKPTPMVAAAPPTTRLVGPPEVPVQDRARPNPNEGLTPDEQIQRRNQASRADASILAAKRAAAASRALGLLQTERPTPTASVPPAPVSPAPATPPPAPTAAPAPRAPAASAPAAAPAPAPAPRAPAASIPTPAPRPTGPSTSGATSPLLEVSTSPLGADLEHLGDRLAIFPDRVELRDRLDRVRRSIPGPDIVDVSVEKRPHGATLTVESAEGPGIAAKGLRPDQAVEARRLILEKTRPERMVGRAATASPAPAAPAPASTTPAAAPAKRAIDAAELRAKLADLHRAGVLTDDEYREKVALVGRLAGGERLSRSPR